MSSTGGQPTRLAVGLRKAAAACLLLIVCCATQLVNPKVSRAALAPGVVGVNAVTLRLLDTESRQYDFIKADGFTSIRLLVEWPLIERSQGDFDWALTDRLINDATARGLSILGVLTYAPAWAALPAGPGQVHPAPRDLSAWANFVSVAAQRYRGKIANWEVWNEPNVVASFAPAPDAVRYSDMLIRANLAIKSADPFAVVVTGGTSPTVDGGGEIAPATFIDQLYRNGAGNSFDAVAMHPYSSPAFLSEPGEPYSSHNAINAVTAVLASHGQGNKKIWFTEYGAPTTDVGERAVSAAGQADILRDAIRYLRSLPNGGPIFIFDHMDISTGSSNPEYNYGLRRSDFSPKPALAVVQSVASEPWR